MDGKWVPLLLLIIYDLLLLYLDNAEDLLKELFCA